MQSEHEIANMEGSEAQAEHALNVLTEALKKKLSGFYTTKQFVRHSMISIKLNSDEISILYDLLKDRQEKGSYFGNKEQYYKGIQSILDKLSKASWKEEIKNERNY